MTVFFLFDCTQFVYCLKSVFYPMKNTYSFQLVVHLKNQRLSNSRLFSLVVIYADQNFKIPKPINIHLLLSFISFLSMLNDDLTNPQISNNKKLIFTKLLAFFYIIITFLFITHRLWRLVKFILSKESISSLMDNTICFISLANDGFEDFLNIWRNTYPQIFYTTTIDYRENL